MRRQQWPAGRCLSSGLFPAISRQSRRRSPAPRSVVCCGHGRPVQPGAPGAGRPPSPEREFWERRYAEPGYAYGTEPNGFLVEVADRIPPGPVLCLAEGEGRNAVWLAGRGHAVTAVDASAAGLAKAEALARARGVRDRDDRRRSRVLHHRARGLVGNRRDLRPPAAAAAPRGPPRRRRGARAGRRLRPRGLHAAPARARHRRPAETGAALHARDAARRPGRPGPGDRPGGRARRRGGAATTRAAPRSSRCWRGVRGRRPGAPASGHRDPAGRSASARRARSPRLRPMRRCARPATRLHRRSAATGCEVPRRRKAHPGHASPRAGIRRGEGPER